MSDNQIPRLLVTSILSAALTVSCGSSDSEETATEVLNSGSATELATAYPGGLAISVFPQQESATLRLQDESKDDSSESQTISEKNEEAEELLSGEAESCLASVFNTERTAPTITCYEFDQEMIYGSMHNQLGTRDGTAASGEACLIAFARAQVTDVETMIDKALGLVQGMMCQAAKNGKAGVLPTAGGEAIDYSTDLSTALESVEGMTVSVATVKRLADQNSRPVFRSDITIALGSEGTMELHLVHSPTAEDDNTTYNGVLWSRTVSSSQEQNSPTPVDQYVSVRYAKTSSANIQAELIRANMDSDLGEIAFVNGVLDLNAGADFEVGSNDQNYGNYKNPTTSEYYQFSNNAIGGIMYISFNVNPEDSTGTTSYWQNPGGSYSESARGMIFEMTSDTDGAITGCGLSGAAYVSTQGNNGLSIRAAQKDGSTVSPNGFYHPFMNTNNSGGPGNEGCTLTFATGTDSTGSYHLKDCNGNSTLDAPTNNEPAMEAQWYVPDLSNSTLANSWVTEQTGTLVSRQCVATNTDGLYVIDTTEITENAGFELIDSTASDFATYEIAAPVLTGLIDFEIDE